MRRSLKHVMWLTLVVVVAVQLRAFTFFPHGYAFLVKFVLLVVKLAFFSAGLVGWGAVTAKALQLQGLIRPAAAWALGAILTATLLGLVVHAFYPAPWMTMGWLGLGTLAALIYRKRLDWKRPRLALGRLRAWFPVFLVAPILLALAPAISQDSLVYHLAVPHQFELAGRAFEMPWNAHTYFPLHAEMLFGMALQLGGGQLAQLLHLLTMLLALLAVARIGTRLFSRQAGAWSALLLLSTPVLNLIAGWAWNDWFVLLYISLALESYYDHQESGGSFALLAAFVAASFSVKYYALPLLLLLVLPLPRPAIRKLLVAGAIVAAVALPWYGKNLLLTGNPVYPLFSAESADQSLTSYRGEEPFWDRISAYVGRIDLIDESLGVLLVCLFPLLLALPNKGDSSLRVLWLFFLVYLGTALVFGPTVRAFSPLLLVFALLAGGAVSSLHLGKLWRALGLVGVNAALVVNLAQILWVVDKYEPLGAAFTFVTDHQYLSTGQKYFAAFEWIDREAGPDDKVLVVGESRIFYLDRVAVAGTYLDPHPVSGFGSAGCDPGCLAERLWSEGIRWIYFDPTQYGVAIEPRSSLSNELLFLVTRQEAEAFAGLIQGFAQERFVSGEQRVLALLRP